MVDLLSTGQTAQLRPRTAAIVTAVLEQEERYSRHLFLISGHWDLRCARDLPRWHPHSAGPRQAFTVAFAARVTDLGPRQEEQVRRSFLELVYFDPGLQSRKQEPGCGLSYGRLSLD
jgi:hypothetical protein